jgi:hypothetical protein
VIDFGEFCHDIDLSFVLWYFFEHLLLHKLDSDDSVLRKMIALIDDPIVTLPQLLGTIDVEIFVHFLHALHPYKFRYIIQLRQQTNK